MGGTGLNEYFPEVIVFWWYVDLKDSDGALNRSGMVWECTEKFETMVPAMRLPARKFLITP